LSSYEYFGQYGKINKLVVNKNMPYNQNNQKGPSFSAYITFANEREASMAIYVKKLIMEFLQNFKRPLMKFLIAIGF